MKSSQERRRLSGTALPVKPDPYQNSNNPEPEAVSLPETAPDDEPTAAANLLVSSPVQPRPTLTKPRLQMQPPPADLYSDPATIVAKAREKKDEKKEGKGEGKEEDDEWMNVRTQEARERLKETLRGRSDLLKEVPVHRLTTLHHKVSRETTGGWVDNAHALATSDEKYSEKDDAFSEFDPYQDKKEADPAVRLRGKRFAVRNLLSNMELGPENPLGDRGSRFDPNTQDIQPGLPRQLTPRSEHWKEADKHGNEGDKKKKIWEEAKERGDRQEAERARQAAIGEYRKAAEAIRKAEGEHQKKVEEDFEVTGGARPSGKQTISFPRTDQWQAITADLRPEERKGKGGNIISLQDGTKKVRLPNGNTASVEPAVEHGTVLGYYRMSQEPAKDEQERVRKVNEAVGGREKRADETAIRAKNDQAMSRILGLETEKLKIRAGKATGPMLDLIRQELARRESQDAHKGPYDEKE